MVKQKNHLGKSRGVIFTLIIAILGLALSACGGEASKKEVIPPKPYWGTIESYLYTYTGGVQTPTAHSVYDSTQNALVKYTDPGPDTIWGTGDDLPVNYTVYQTTVVVNEYKVSEGNTFTLGGDGTPFNADDVENSYWTYSYDASGNYLSSRNFSPGVDTVIRTADDVFSGQDNVWVGGVWRDIIVYSNSVPSTCFQGTLDANNNVTQQDISTPGADLTCFTADDTMNSYMARTYDANNKLTFLVKYSGTGADATWYTGDDTVSYIQSFVYDVAGNLIRMETLNAGVDGIPGNGDDVMTSKNVYTNDAAGNRTHYFYQLPGPDGLWDTIDDQILSEYWFGAY
ncbi:MAG: hypothetical protein OEZ59_01755 [Deltaproteobacteria bacterium]|nr:hypothetical protein [Deltaproteobacteria bacterium]